MRFFSFFALLIAQLLVTFITSTGFADDMSGEVILTQEAVVKNAIRHSHRLPEDFKSIEWYQQPQSTATTSFWVNAWDVKVAYKHGDDGTDQLRYTSQEYKKALASLKENGHQGQILIIRRSETTSDVITPRTVAYRAEKIGVEIRRLKHFFKKLASYYELEDGPFSSFVKPIFIAYLGQYKGEKLSLEDRFGMLIENYKKLYNNAAWESGAYQHEDLYRKLVNSIAPELRFLEEMLIDDSACNAALD